MFRNGILGKTRSVAEYKGRDSWTKGSRRTFVGVVRKESGGDGMRGSLDEDEERIFL